MQLKAAPKSPHKGHADLGKNRIQQGGAMSGPAESTERQRPISPGNDMSTSSDMKTSSPARGGDRGGDTHTIREDKEENANIKKLKKIVFLYGSRTVDDLLCKDLLLKFQEDHPGRFKVVFCVGSRYTDVHMGAKYADRGKSDSTETAATISSSSSSFSSSSYNYNSTSTSSNDNSNGNGNSNMRWKCGNQNCKFTNSGRQAAQVSHVGSLVRGGWVGESIALYWYTGILVYWYTGILVVACFLLSSALDSYSCLVSYLITSLA